MTWHLHLSSPSAPDPRQVALTTPGTAGGSRADAAHLPGAPPAALALAPVAAGVVVTAAAAGVRAAGHPLHPGARRLLRPGESAEVAGWILHLPGPGAEPGTRLLAGALLRDAAAHRDPAAGAGPHLLVLTGAGAGRRAPVRGEASIGRSRSCTLRLEDPLASRTHARVRLGPRGAWIEDARSRNGVTLNGVRLDRGPRPLRPGDLIGVGDTTVAYEDPGAAAPASATSPAGAPAPRAREEEAPCAAPAPPPPAPLAPGAALPAAPIVAAAALLAACAAALAGAG